MAVGSYLSPHNVRVALAEHWNGTSWTIDTVPTPSGFDDLSGVACASATSCIAVGSAGAATLAETLEWEHLDDPEHTHPDRCG